MLEADVVAELEPDVDAVVDADDVAVDVPLVVCECVAVDVAVDVAVVVGDERSQKSKSPRSWSSSALLSSCTNFVHVPRSVK